MSKTQAMEFTLLILHPGDRRATWRAPIFGAVEALREVEWHTNVAGAYVEIFAEDQAVHISTLRKLARHEATA